MIAATLAEAAEAVSAPPPATDRSFRGVSTDTRTLEHGNLFVALAGPNFDGHDFLAQAVERGAAGAIVAKGRALDVPGFPCLEVADTLRALGDLAAWHRRRFPRLTVVGITGTSGKTTTKDFLSSIVRLRRRAVVTEGNLNNRIGVPLTLFRVGSETEAAVIEMGMNEPGEIARLAEIASPDVGIVTNAGPGHLEGLGSVENIAKEKGDLLAALDPARGVAILDRDAAGFDLLAGRPRCRLVTVGEGEGASHRISGVVSRGLDGISFRWRGVEVALRVPGRHAVHCAALAAAAAEEIGLDPLDVLLGLSQVRPRAGRGRGFVVPPGARRETGVLFYDDAYNANPLSFRAALSLLAETAAERRIVAMGDMLELGEAAEGLHAEIGGEVSKVADALFAIGPFSRAAVRAAHGRIEAAHFPDGRALAGHLAGYLRPGDLVLFKGSRGMRLETVMEETARLLSQGGGEVVPMRRLGA